MEKRDQKIAGMEGKKEGGKKEREGGKEKFSQKGTRKGKERKGKETGSSINALMLGGV